MGGFDENNEDHMRCRLRVREVIDGFCGAEIECDCSPSDQSTGCGILLFPFFSFSFSLCRPCFSSDSRSASSSFPSEILPRWLLAGFLLCSDSESTGMASSISAMTASTSTSSSSLSSLFSVFTLPKRSGLGVNICAVSSSSANLAAVSLMSSSYSLSSFLRPLRSSSLKVSWFLICMRSSRSFSILRREASRFFLLPKLVSSSMTSTSFFMRITVSRGASSQKSTMLSAFSRQQCRFSWRKRKRTKSYCGPSSAPDSWYFQMTWRDSLWYLRTVMAMTTDRFTNSSRRRLQVILRLLMDLRAICSTSITLKKTHRASANLRTSPCPRSMNCRMKMEIVWTAFALTSSELVSHHSSSSRMKALPTSSSPTRLWKSSRQSASMVRIRTSASLSRTRSSSLRMQRSWVKALPGSSCGMVSFERSNFTMKSVVALRETSRCSLHRSSAVMCIQQSGMNRSTRTASSRQYSPSRISPCDCSGLARSSLMTGMKSSILMPARSLLRMRIIDLVLIPSTSSCSSISANLALRVGIMRVSPCASTLRMLAWTTSLSLSSVFSSGLFHSAMICLSSISQWSGQSAFMAAPASWRRSQELLSRGRSKQDSIILRWQRVSSLRGGQMSSCSRPDHSQATSKYSSSVTTFFSESNILFRPISSADFCKLNNCRHSQIDHRSRPFSNSSSTRASSVPDGTHSSKMALASDRSTFPMFLNQISSGKASLPPLPLPSCLSSWVSPFVKLQSLSTGSSSTIPLTRLSKRAYICGQTSSTPGRKSSTNSPNPSSRYLSKKREKQRRVSCWTDVSLFPKPSQSRCSRLQAFISSRGNFSPVSLRRTMLRIYWDLSLSLMRTRSMLPLLRARLVTAILRICSLSSVARILKSSSSILSRSSCCHPRTSAASLMPTCLQVETFSRRRKKIAFRMFPRVSAETAGSACLTRWNIILAVVMRMPRIDENMPSARKLRKQLNSPAAGPSSSANSSVKREAASCSNFCGILRLAFSWKILKILRQASSKAPVKADGSVRKSRANSKTCALEAACTLLISLKSWRTASAVGGESRLFLSLLSLSCMRVQQLCNQKGKEAPQILQSKLVALLLCCPRVRLLRARPLRPSARLLLLSPVCLLALFLGDGEVVEVLVVGRRALHGGVEHGS